MLLHISLSDQETNTERLRIWIEDDDRNVPIGFIFAITELGETPPGMIAFEDADQSNKERWLHIVSSMDRENEKIRELDGVLTYNLTVTDLGNNHNFMMVSHKKN
jgi:hypothetical protein